MYANGHPKKFASKYKIFLLITTVTGVLFWSWGKLHSSPATPDTLTHVVAQAGMWVVDHNRPEDQPATGTETVVIVDDKGVPYIRQPDGRFILLRPESLRAAYGTSIRTSLLIERLDHSQWLTLAAQSADDRTVRAVRAACNSGIDVLVFHENGMIATGSETYNPICEDVPMSSAEAPGATEQAWQFNPHTETPDRVVKGIMSTIQMGNRGGSIALRTDDRKLQSFVFYETPGCPPVPPSVWSLGSDAQGKRFEIRYREVTYTGPILSLLLSNDQSLKGLKDAMIVSITELK